MINILENENIMVYYNEEDNTYRIDCFDNHEFKKKYTFVPYQPKNKKVIYISGAITGIEDYMDYFMAAEKKLVSQGYTVINPARVNAQLPDETPYNTYMDVSIAMLSHCDAIYMLRGWEYSRGAKCELNYAETYGLEIFYQE